MLFSFFEPEETQEPKMDSRRCLLDNYLNIDITFYYLIALGLAIFLIWAEGGSQDAKDYKRKEKNKEKVCNHWLKDENIHKRIDLNHTVVNWRRAILASIILTSILYLLIRRFPGGFEFFLVSAVIFSGLYFSSVWIQQNWWEPRDKQLSKLIRDKLF